MARLNERNDWFDLWFEDKQAMMGAMMRNMAADLAAGYNPKPPAGGRGNPKERTNSGVNRLTI